MINSIVTSQLTTPCTEFSGSKKCSFNEKSGEGPWPLSPLSLFPSIFTDPPHLLSPSAPALVPEHRCGSVCSSCRKPPTEVRHILPALGHIAQGQRGPQTCLVFPLLGFFLNCVGLCPKLSLPKCQPLSSACPDPKEKTQKTPFALTPQRGSAKLFRWIFSVGLQESTKQAYSLDTDVSLQLWLPPG